MLLPYMLLLLLPVLVAAQPGLQATTPTTLTNRETRRDEAAGEVLDLFGESILDVVDTLLPASKSSYEPPEERRRKKLKLNKYVLPLIVGFVLIKSILLPIALKALAVLSGKAVVLSVMSLILAAIVGLKKVAQKDGHYDLANKHRRQDIFDFTSGAQELEPYRYYKERRRKK